MDLMITLLGTDTVRSTDFPVHWLKRQAPSHFKSAQSNLIIIIDTKIKFFLVLTIKLGWQYFHETTKMCNVQ